MRHIRKHWRKYALIVLAVVLLAACIKTLHPSRYFYEATQRALWSYEDTVLIQAEHSRRTRPEIIFFGDSLISNLPTSKLGKDAANYGIAGDTIDGLLMRLPSYDLSRTRIVVIEVGVNNWSRDQFAGFGLKYRGLLNQLPPSARVLATGLLPVNRSAGRYFDVAALRPSALTANIEIRRACQSLPRCALLDLTPILSDSRGALREEYSLDGLHLSAAGYDAWLRELKVRLR